MTELERLISKEQILCTCTQVTPTTFLSPNYTAWQVVLKYNRRAYTTPFYTMNGVSPQAAFVIGAILGEVNGFQGTDGSFEQWAMKHGFSLDSRTAYSMWQEVTKTAPKLKSFFGVKYNEFLRAAARE